MSNYVEEQAKWVKKHGLKAGDKVKILRGFDRGEGCFDNGITPMMVNSIGKVLEIECFYKDSIGIYDKWNDISWSWPYFVLKPIKEGKTTKPKKLKVSIDRAREWYKSGNEALKEIALEVYEKSELKEVENSELDKLPTSWEEVQYFGAWFYNAGGDIKYRKILGACKENTLCFATEELLKAADALAKLSILIKIYNGDWTPDWACSSQYKYTLYIKMNNQSGYFRINTGKTEIAYCLLSFPTEEKRDHFKLHHEALILQAAPIICRY